VGVIKALGTVTPYIARQLGYFAEAGLDVEIVDFQDGPTMMEAFVSGNIDITYGGIAPAAIWRAQGVKLKVVAATNSGGHLILVREDSGLSALADLKGKKVATPRTGSVTDTMFRGLVLRDLLGADPERDLAIFAGMAPADMPAALLLTREVDAIVTWEPFAAACLLQYGGARVLFSFPDYWHQTHGRDYPVNVVAAHEDLIRTRPQDLKRFLEIHVRTQRFINAEVDKANALIAAELGLEVPVIARARPNLGFTWEVEVEDCMVILGYAQALGYIKALPQAAELFDLSFLSGR
jgi:NitT/TauT family transport system substrate-binding protein